MLFLRLCLVAVKRFPENTYFPEKLISGKGKYFSMFGCILKKFPENIFWCLEKKKENTNPEKHKPQPRSLRPTFAPSIAIDGATARSREDRDLAVARSRRRSRSRTGAGARDLGLDLLLSRARALSLSLSLIFRKCFEGKIEV